MGSSGGEMRVLMNEWDHGSRGESRIDEQEYLKKALELNPSWGT